jgi:exodeoxyribonuclease V alpha subunit
MSAQVTEARIAVGATGLLAAFNGAGALSAADVHVAQRLARLGGEANEAVLLAAALTVAAVRGGSVCVTLRRLADEGVPGSEVPVESAGSLPWPEPGAWEEACAASPLVACGVDGDPGRPLRLVDGRMYLDRYWRQEQLVREEVDRRVAGAVPPVDRDALREAISRVYGDEATGRQRLASAVAAASPLTVLTGGPGTGKTTTVARLLAVLMSLPGGPQRVALAAPTGKAAARLQEAVWAELEQLGRRSGADSERVGRPAASTVHRLLGWKAGSRTRFRHDRDNRLPHDLVVVDETSMVPLTLMSRLLEALRPQARLVLVGDPDQLASVEAGAVLGDLVARPVLSSAIEDEVRSLVPELVPTDAEASALGNGIVRLDRVHRFGSRIGELAEAIRRGDAEQVLSVLRGGSAEVAFCEIAAEDAVEIAALRSDVVAAGSTLVEAARNGDERGALRAVEQHRLLVAHRRGPAGVARWTAVVEDWLDASGHGPESPGEWYAGRPLLVTANDRDTGLYNGDTGVVVRKDGALVAAFGTPDSPVFVRPHRLSSVQTVHAMTVHRGQGSQFSRVSLVLPPAESPLLTRELLYTAVTRARDFVRVVGTEDAVRAAVARPVRRASGLRTPLGSTA